MREVLTKENSRFLAEFVMIAGLLRREEPKLLGSGEIKARRVGFDSEVEANYMARLPIERRTRTLTVEVTTAVAEATRFSFAQHYRYVDGKIIDEISGEPLEKLLRNGQQKEETEAFIRIQEEMRDQNVVVAHFSPANEELRYPKGAVDLWIRLGERVFWSRATVDDNFEKMSEVYGRAGGSKVASEKEMLSKPIRLERVTSEELWRQLKVTKEKRGFSQAQIQEVTRQVVADFEQKFGRNFVTDADKVFRVYSAVMTEVKNWIKRKVAVVVDQIRVGWRMLQDFAYQPLVVTQMATGGCDSSTLVGRLGNKIMGVVGLVTGYINSLVEGKSFNCPRCNGKIESGKGIETCPHCGLTKQEAGSACG